MQLSPSDFNSFLFDIGQSILWRKAFSCPCINLHSGAAKPGCPLCLGKGRSWGDPVEGYAGMSGQSVQRTWAQFGVAELGDVVLTLPSDTPAYDAGQFDRFTLADSSEPFSSNITHGSADSLRFTPSAIDRVFWIVDNVAVEGAAPDVDENGVMTWTSGEPPTGAVYSITGRVRPEYFIFSAFPSDRSHQHGSRLPRKVVLRKFDLYGR